jgi:CRISPR-associated endonuclease/helicase Cas3
VIANNPYWLWAKLPKTEVNARSFHPLICHMLDVAVVAREMWRGLLPEAARRRIAESLQLPEQEAETWITYIAALHDLGKASPAFQLRKDAKNLFKIYEELGKPSTVEAKDCPHGRVTAGELPEILISEFGIDRDTANRLSVIVGGHHGTFPTSHELMNRYPDAGVGIGAKWKQIRLGLAQRLKDTLGVSNDVIPRGCDHSAAMFIAGLVSVADWIGSSDFFPYLVEDFDALPTTALSGYLRDAESKAQHALTRLGWMGWTQSAKPLLFSQLFPFIESRRPLQDAAIAIAGKLTPPGIVIIEAPMGEGKTEAALYLADRWGIHPGPRGCYIALPTQATSNQMFTRVRGFLTARYPADTVNFQLLHGHAALSSEFQILRKNGDKTFNPEAVYSDDDCGTHGTNVVAAEWFMHRKRGLLAPFGVGTVDQALLAVLQTRHVFVRLFGLSHKVVVVDEVHAYDAYMSKLLERLLEWLAALGSPVILLSATLPDNRRKALLKAYLRGINRGLSAVEEIEINASYPRISWANVSGQGAQTIEVSDRIRRTLKIEWIDDAKPLGQRLKDALAEGGCAAVICNTVNRAQQTYQELQSFFADEELDLFHARFLFKDRNQREKQALGDFGKKGELIKFDDGEERTVHRPFRKVLVATQVIEQSLDLDFDLMVTDCAPVDLILQRSGRLHRHERTRPANLTEPMLWIRQPDSVEAGVPEFDRGAVAVYDAHVLLRSWLALRAKSKINIPGEIETLIESVYGERDCPETASEALRDRWQKTADDLRGELKRMEAEAVRVVVPEPNYPDDIFDLGNKRLEEDEPEMHKSLQALTRLTEPNVSVICLSPEQRQQFKLTKAPTVAAARDLLGYSVTLSNPRVVWTLLDQKPHSAWSKSALLRRYRLLELDETGCCAVGKYRLQVHPELGVTIKDSGKEPEKQS